MLTRKGTSPLVGRWRMTDNDVPRTIIERLKDETRAALERSRQACMVWDLHHLECDLCSAVADGASRQCAIGRVLRKAEQSSRFDVSIAGEDLFRISGPTRANEILREPHRLRGDASALERLLGTLLREYGHADVAWRGHHQGCPDCTVAGERNRDRCDVGKGLSVRLALLKRASDAVDDVLASALGVEYLNAIAGNLDRRRRG